MSNVWEVPQPWGEDSLAGREAHLAKALAAEAEGKRLVVETYVNAYPEDHDGTWVVEAIVVTDWRTEEHIVTHETNVDEHLPSSDDWFLVKRLLAEV